MKKTFFIILIVLISVNIYSQAPEAFTYNAIVSDNTGQPLVNHTVAFRFNILKGSNMGFSVYGEKHSATTDQFGAVSLIIGNGTEKTGDFASIDWGGDSYFLMIELDPAGGTSYTHLGTTQLLSVPYSLYAKSAGNVSGVDGSETRISAGNFITISGSGTITDPYIITNMLTGDYNDLVNKPVTNGSETKIEVEDNLTISGSGTIDDPYLLNTRVHYVGESYGGGIVFYIYDNGQHGLIAAVADQNPGIEWYNSAKRYTNTTGDGVNAGSMNTTLIVAIQTNDNPTGNFASKVCADYSVTFEGRTYGDWYLPSKYELGLLFIQKDMVGGFNDNYYWSSTEFSSISAWSQNFSTGVQYNLDKSLPYGVRAIRAF